MKAYFSIKFVIFIVFSVLIIVLRDTLLINLKYLVAALLLAFGTENIIFHAIFHKKDCIRKYQFIYGFIQLILGFTVLFGVESFESVCVIWGVWSISRETFEIHEIAARKVTGIVALVSAIESIVTITFSVMLLNDPTEHHAQIHIYLLIAEFMVTAFSPVVSGFIEHYKKKNDNQIS